MEHDPSKISFDEETSTYHIHTHTSTDCPVHKMKRINTQTKHVHTQLFPDIENHTNVEQQHDVTISKFQQIVE